MKGNRVGTQSFSCISCQNIVALRTTFPTREIRETLANGSFWIFARIWSTIVFTYCWWEHRVELPLWKVAWWYLTWTDTCPDSKILPFSLHPRQMKTNVHPKIYVQNCSSTIIQNSKIEKYVKLYHTYTYIHIFIY